MSSRFRITRLGYEITCDSPEDLTAAVAALGVVVDKKSYNIGLSTSGWKCEQVQNADGVVTRAYTPNDFIVTGCETGRMEGTKPHSLSMSSKDLADAALFIANLDHVYSRLMLKALLDSPSYTGTLQSLSEQDKRFTVEVGRDVIRDFRFAVAEISSKNSHKFFLHTEYGPTNFQIKLSTEFAKYLSFYSDDIFKDVDKDVAGKEPKSEAAENEVKPAESVKASTYSMFGELLAALSPDSRLRGLFKHMNHGKYSRAMTLKDAADIAGYPTPIALRGGLAAMSRCCNKMGFASDMLYRWHTDKESGQKVMLLTPEFREYLKSQK